MVLLIAGTWAASQVPLEWVSQVELPEVRPLHDGARRKRCRQLVRVVQQGAQLSVPPMSILSNHSTVRVMKSRSIFRTLMVFLVVLLLGNAVPALAQQTEAVGAFVEAQRTSITFDMKGQISQEKTELPEFPLTIIERLVQEKALARLDIQSDSGRSSDLLYPFTIRFTFTSMDAFTQWYTSQSTRQLLQDIRAEATFDIALAVQRDPRASSREH